MISKTDLAPITDYKASGRILSVYLDVDQSHAENLNRHFELAFDSKIKEAGICQENSEQVDFERCVSQVRSVLRAYEPRARGLVIFSRPNGAIWMRELNIPVTTEIFWGPAAHIRQFLEALDEFETYGVVLADRSRGRIFTVKLGSIEKQADIRAVNGVRHSKTAGTDHLFSQPRLQRKADEHALSHLKRVAEMLEHVVKFAPFDRLILGGATEATSELFRLLSKPLRRMVIASLSLPPTAPESRIVEEVLFAAGKAERAREQETVEMLITAAAKERQAVVMLPSTLSALNANRVRELVYGESASFEGAVCEACDAFFPAGTATCEFCGLPVNARDNLSEPIIAKALAEGATIEQVRGVAAEMLKPAGGIGAFLRY
jgi:peptide subunit release factor 1 (eRF1)